MQQLWVPSLQRRQEECGREADDVQVVAFDSLDEAAAETLDRIGAGAALPFAASDVGVDEIAREETERDVRRLVREHVLRSAEQAQTGDNGVRPTRQPAEHPPGVLAVRSLAVDAIVEDHRRVDAERDEPLAVRRSCLPLRMPEDELHRVGIRWVVLDVVRRDNLERDRELLEDRAALRRGGREDEPLRHEGFAATQISSAGHFRAQSAENAA